MFRSLARLAQPFLQAVDPERAHDLAIEALRMGFHPRQSVPDDAALAVDLWDLKFPNPLGMAAGFDKNGVVPDALLAMGLGFAEAGTVTPLPQAGNPKPRVFRISDDRAVINRLGFNNGGHIQALARLGRFRASRMGGGIVGVNIGANKHTEDKAADYVSGIEHFYGVASYFMVNISSPNTPGLRDLQAPAALDDLLGRVMEKRAALVAEGRPSVPIAVKIAPDVAEADLPAICDRIVANGADAIAVSNTTLARPVGLDPLFTKEAGGLSGKPLFHRSTAMLARVHQLVGGRLPLIGVGGISSGETALQKIEAGASLIQLYTGLIYEGPSLIGRIKQSLAAACTDAQVASISELAGRRAAEWASKPVEG